MVRWTYPAKRDLKRIYDYIAEDSIFYARKVAEDIVSKSEFLKIFQRWEEWFPNWKILS